MKTVKINQFVINYLGNIKLLTLLLVMVTSFSNAQVDKAYIEITEQVEYSREIEKYSATIIIAESLVYNSYEENSTFEKIKSDYFKKLESNNFNTSELKEDAFAYAALGYRKKGMIYQFETTSEDKLIKLLSINGNGVSINEKYVHYKPLSAKTVEDLSKKAISESKKRANSIANSAGKKVGELVYLSNYKEESKRAFYSAINLKNHIFSVNVKYKLH
ncbi:hypothetical protein EGM88_01730 [Aureibaculum marinum]|uniref:DUF541 domain-containing protein n=1 Tax=Aureibaculum marinum TaxID=2487930 RepID=A0A3N4P539_9FLAO|nr:hypothetical protein [Aureibaculum marinum]RPE00007.1 hypothetical protein EGM88_01730 [Aureibaculum marinum]